MFTNSINLLFFSLSSNLPGTPDLTCPPGGDETDFPTRRGSPFNGRWVTDMLMVTTTVGMLDWVHSHTSDLWPAVPLDSIFVISPASFQHWFIAPTASGDAADDAPVFRGVKFLDAGWELDSGSAGVWIVGDDGAVATGSFGDFTSVSGFFFHGADDGTFWAASDWEDVTDGELGFFTAVDELAGMNTLWADNSLNSLPVFVWVVEDNLG